MHKIPGPLLLKATNQYSGLREDRDSIPGSDAALIERGHRAELGAGNVLMQGFEVQRFRHRSIPGTDEQRCNLDGRSLASESLRLRFGEEDEEVDIFICFVRKGSFGVCFFEILRVRCSEGRNFRRTYAGSDEEKEGSFPKA